MEDFFAPPVAVAKNDTSAETLVSRKPLQPI
jgi:hypothetical protein